MTDAALALLAAARRLAETGLNSGSAGNLSVRTAGGFLITPSGIAPEELTADMMVPMTLDGDHSGPWPPSSEWRFHRDLYRTRPEAGAVIHCHSPAATALACHRRDLPPFHYMILRFGGPDVRCARYARFGTQALSDAVLEALSGRRACLMANHGMLVCGRDLPQALALAQELETLCEHYLRARTLGEPVHLTDEEIAEAQEAIAGYGRR